MLYQSYGTQIMDKNVKNTYEHFLGEHGGWEPIRCDWYGVWWRQFKITNDRLLIKGV